MIAMNDSVGVNRGRGFRGREGRRERSVAAAGGQISLRSRLDPDGVAGRHGQSTRL